MEFGVDYLIFSNSFTNCFICLQSVSLNIHSEEQINLTNLFFKYLKIEDEIEGSFVCESCYESLKRFVELSKSIISEKTRLEMDYLLGSVKTAILSSKSSKAGDGVVSSREMVAKKCLEKMQKRQPQIILERLPSKLVKEERSPSPNSDCDNDWFPEVDEGDYVGDAVSPDIKPEISHFSGIPNARKRKLKCRKCSKKFYNKHQLNTHNDTVHPQLRLFKCSKCSKKFANKYYLKYHYDRVHLGLKPYKCDTCDKAYATLQRLKIHQATPHNPKPLVMIPLQDKKFICEICEKSLGSAESLRNHKRKVHSEKKYSCQICEKSFKQGFHLKSHISAVHENKKFYCQVPGCDKAYSIQQNLSNHYRLNHPDFKKPSNHTDYSNKITVTIDLKNGEKEFECNLCSKKLKTNDAIKQHIRLVHEPKKFECSECGFKASKKCKLESHIQSMHKKKEGHELGTGDEEPEVVKGPQSTL